MKYAVVVALALSLAACASVIASGPRSVTVSGNDWGKAQALAEHECQKYERHARLISSYGVFQYDCVQ